MRRIWLVALATVVACKSSDKKSEPAASTGGSAAPPSAPAAGSGSGSGSAAAPVAPTPPPPAAGKLEIDPEAGVERDLAFDKKAPQLPAVSPDRTSIATWGSDLAGMPTPVIPWQLEIERLDGTGKHETLPLIDEKMMSAEESWDSKPPDAATVKTIHERAAAITKRLAGWSSLATVDVGNTYEEIKPTAVGVGDHKLAASQGDDYTLTLTLMRGGKVVRRAVVESYTNASETRGEAFENAACEYHPVLGSVHVDAAKTALYLSVGFRFGEMCTQQPTQWIVWPFAGEDPDPGAALAKDAVAITGSTVAPATSKPETGSAIATATSADAKSAWASLVAADGTRASYVLASTPDGWRVVAVHTSKPVPNAKANADAKANKIARAPFTAEPGDAALRDTFAKLTTEGLVAPPAGLVALGTAAGERTTGGPAFARAWNAAWKGKTTVTSSVARTAPSGTTGWVAATVEVAKTGYKMPLHVFAVFDKRGGTWTLVHIHLSV